MKYHYHCRDECGWRIPRKGSKSEQIYDLLIAGFRTKEIYNLFQQDRNNSSIGVLISRIRQPEKHNKWSNNWIKANPRKRVAQVRINSNYSPYVRKLVRALEISYTEAVDLERKELEKVK